MPEEIARLSFSAPMIEWRGPAPFHFLAIPDDLTGELQYAARLASYGWGCVPVTAQIAQQVFTTSLMPRAGSYLLPLKNKVRHALGIAPGDFASATIIIHTVA